MYLFFKIAKHVAVPLQRKSLKAQVGEFRDGDAQDQRSGEQREWKGEQRGRTLGIDQSAVAERSVWCTPFEFPFGSSYCFCCVVWCSQASHTTPRHPATPPPPRLPPTPFGGLKVYSVVCVLVVRLLLGAHLHASIL